MIAQLAAWVVRVALGVRLRDDLPPPTDTFGPMRQRWNVGDTVVRREVKGLSPLDDGDRSAPWFDRAWIEMPMRVVEDDGDDLALFVASGTAFTFPDGVWEAGKEHPWKANGAWRGSTARGPTARAAAARCARGISPRPHEARPGSRSA